MRLRGVLLAYSRPVAVRLLAVVPWACILLVVAAAAPLVCILREVAVAAPLPSAVGPSVCNLPVGAGAVHLRRAEGPLACNLPAAVVLPAVPEDSSAAVLGKVDILASEVVPCSSPFNASLQ